MGHAMVFGFLGIKTVNTITPLWLVGLGALLGMLLVAVFWGILLGLSMIPGLGGVRRAADELWTTVREGVLFPVLIIVCVFGAIGILGTVALRPIGDSMAILASIPRLNQVGTRDLYRDDCGVAAKRRSGEGRGAARDPDDRRVSW